jgi:hypothetical protein
MAATNSTIAAAHETPIKLQDRCPWCEQPISHHKFIQIQARIKADERQRLAKVEARLRTQYEHDLAERDALAQAAFQKARTDAAAALNAEKKASAKREERARNAAATKAREQFREQLNKSLADTKAAEAATKLAQKKLEALKAKQEKQTTERVQEEVQKVRRTLEKDKEHALNQERSNAFERNQKLQNKVEELNRQLQRKTADELGEGAELDLFNELRNEYPGDRIQRIKKGEAGADIRHSVLHKGQLCGLIVYDSKDRNAWRTEWVTKLREDQIAAKAEHAVLSSRVFPANKRQLCVQDGVIIANPARVLAIVDILREDVMKAHRLRLSADARKAKTAKLYAFITSDRFLQLVSRVDELTEELLDLETKEMAVHQRIKSILKTNSELRVEVNSILEG